MGTMGKNHLVFSLLYQTSGKSDCLTFKDISRKTHIRLSNNVEFGRNKGEKTLSKKRFDVNEDFLEMKNKPKKQKSKTQSENLNKLGCHMSLIIISFFARCFLCFAWF